MPTCSRINKYTGTIDFIIPPRYKDIEQRVLGCVNEEVLEGERDKLINDIGIATAVKTMVYTDAIDEQDRAAPEDVERELCHDCYDTIWNLGNKYNLGPQEQKQSWVIALETISKIVRTTWPEDEVAKMKPFDTHQFEFYAGPDESEPL